VFVSEGRGRDQGGGGQGKISSAEHGDLLCVVDASVGNMRGTPAGRHWFTGDFRRVGLTKNAAALSHGVLRFLLKYMLSGASGA